MSRPSTRTDGLSKADIANIQRTLPRTLHNILKEVQLEGQKLTKSPRRGISNPFTSLDAANWDQGFNDRYTHADTKLGREYMIVALYSATFRATLQSAIGYTFREVLERLDRYKASLMTVAISNGLDPPTHYDGSLIAQQMPLPAGAFPPNNATLGISHPHEAYITADGDRKRCMYTDKNKNTVPMVNIDTNIYRPANFRGFPKPIGDWPEEDGWPPKWKYPMDPSETRADLNIYPKCEVCHKSTTRGGTARTRDSKECACDLEEILVEIKQFDDYPGDTKPVNRGIRALENAYKDDIIGEYCGVFIPARDDAHEHFADDSYSFDFHGPPAKNIVCNDTGTTCCLIAGERGSWTRFINHSHNNANVIFWNVVYGRKLKIVVQAIRRIAVGDELRADYGPNYFVAGPNDTPAEQLASFGGVKRKAGQPAGRVVPTQRATKRRRLSDGSDSSSLGS